MRSEWPVVRLGDHCIKIGSGATPKGGKEAYLEAGPYRLIRSQNVYNEGFSWQGLAFISEEQARRLDGVAVEAGDVLVNITGDSVARVCNAPATALPARVNQHVAIVRPRETSFDTDFLRWVLCSPEQQEILLGLASAGATRNALTKGMLEGLQVPKPPVHVQRDLVAPLVAIEGRIDLLRQTNATLESIARALFASWFIDFDPVRAKVEGREPEGMDAATAALFPAEFEDSALGLIPKGWCVGTVEDLFVLQRGFDLPANQRTNGPYTVFAASGPHGIHSEPMVQGPGVVTGRSGVIGRVFYAHDDYWPLNTALWVKQFKRATAPYAYQYLQKMDLARLNAGSAVPTLNRNHVHAQPAIIPPSALVGVYTAVAEPLLGRIRVNSEHAASLEALRDALLPGLASGKLRLFVAEGQIEEAIG